MCWFLKTSSSHSSSSQSDSSPWKRRVLKWNLEGNFFLWILLLWFLLKHKQAQISNIQRPCRVEASHDSNPFFFLNHLSSGKVWWWWRQMLFVIHLRIVIVRIHPTIEWTHCGGGILFGISDDLSKTQLKCCPPLKYFVNPTFSLEQPSSSFSLPSPLPL